MRALLIAAIMLLCAGCIKHPLIQAFEPKNFGRTIANATKVEATANVRAKLPLLPPGSVQLQSDGIATIITYRPPYDPEALARLIAGEQAKGQAVIVVRQDEKGGPQ